MSKSVDVVIIGAGLTGLTAAYRLQKAGKSVHILERSLRAGGQIATYCEAGFVYEAGPNTGVISCGEVAQLFLELSDKCTLSTARPEAKRRDVWKSGRFRPLPSGLWSAVFTPLFSFSDKLRVLGEPFRAKGTNPNESVASLARRRLGASFVDYAVDPFIGGIYAGNPNTLVTKYALPKLYALEQKYGSFVRGAIAKSSEPKTALQKMATKEIFSAVGGLERLVDALVEAVGANNITLSAAGCSCSREVSGGWLTSYNGSDSISSRYVVSTVGAYCLPDLFSGLDSELLSRVTSLRYAPVVQVSVGVNNTRGVSHPSFGGLIPFREGSLVLGILYPSSCFDGRAPKGGALYSFFLGGIRHSEVIDMSDSEIELIVTDALSSMVGLDRDIKPSLLKIFRYPYAIAQYEVSSGERFEAIDALERQNPGLLLCGNIKGGIGMPNRIEQAFGVVDRVLD